MAKNAAATVAATARVPHRKLFKHENPLAVLRQMISRGATHAANPHDDSITVCVHVRSGFAHHILIGYYVVFLKSIQSVYLRVD
jgi:hypothetical protein